MWTNTYLLETLIAEYAADLEREAARGAAVAGGLIALLIIGTSLAGLGVAAAVGLVVFAALLMLAFHGGAWRAAGQR
jgi:hypothetical protein